MISAGVSTTNIGTGTTVTTPAVAPAASGSGFYVVVVQRCATALAVNIPTDNKGNTFVRIGTQIASSTPMAVDRFYCPNATGGSGYQVSGVRAAGTGSMSVFFQEMPGAAASPLDQSTQATAFAKLNAGAQSLTPGSGGEMLCTLITTDEFSATPISFTAPAGFTTQQSQLVGNTNGAVGALATDIVTAATSYNPTWVGPSNNNIVIFDSFQGSAGAPVRQSPLPLTGVGALAPLAWVIRRRQIRARERNSELCRWGRDDASGLILPEYKKVA
jgi:hypothetical protein